MNTKALILTVIMSGCGMDESSLSKDEDCTTQLTELCKKESAYKDTSEDKKQKAVVKVNVEVNVVVDEFEDETDSIPFLYAEKRMNWAEAVSNAPDGYHVPSIEEMEFILLDYDLDPYSSKTSPRLVWTTTKAGETSSWTIDVKDGSEHSYDRATYLEVIYIGD